MALNTIYFGKVQAVPDFLFRLLVSSIMEALQSIPQKHIPKLIDMGSWGNTNKKIPYESWEWYQNSSLIKRQAGYGQQADANLISHKLSFEPHRKGNPHLDIVLFDKDLTMRSGSDYINFIFGLGSPVLGFILSTARFIQIKDQKIRDVAFRRIVIHEFGHILGLVHRRNNAGTHGLHQFHCNGERGPCVMRQIMSLNELISYAIEEYNSSRIFCADCQTELNSYFN